MDKTNTNQNNFIDILKGLCILFIVITHFTWTTEERLHLLFPFWIEMAVPIFMIISGYVYSLSYQRQRINCFKDAYRPSNVINKIIRYTLPFLVIYLVELAYIVCTGQATLSPNIIWEWILGFLQGGIGPGSYYYPVMIQFIFVYPMIYFILKKYSGNGLVLCFAINALYELFQRVIGMNGDIYRLLIFRYVFVIAAGCYLASKEYKPNFKIEIPICIIGIAYIIGINYLGYTPRIIIYWTNTSFIACLYIIPIIYLLINKIKEYHFAPLEYIGKASYNIFLTQMLWYSFGSWFVEKYITNRAILLVIYLIICIGSGVVFYLIETPITKKLIRKICARK